MKFLAWIVVVSSISGTGQVVAFALSADEPRQGSQQRALSTEHSPFPDRPVRTLFLPAAIGERDLVRYSRVLNLSQEQEHFLRLIYQQYVEENTALKQQRLMELWIQASDAAGPAVMYDPEAARVQRSLYRARNDYSRAMAAIERSLFDRLEPGLSEEQRTLLLRVRLQREREHYPLTNSYLHQATVDLTDIVDVLQRRDALVITDENAFAAELLNYDQQLTALRRSNWDRTVDLMTRGVEMLAERNATDDQARRDELAQSRAAIVRRTGESMIRLADLNDRSADRLAIHLAEGAAAEFRAWHLARAYPKIFPNYFDASEQLQHALTLDELPDHVIDGLQATIDRYDREHERLNRELMRLIRENGEFVATTRLSGGETDRVFNETLIALRNERTQLAEDVLQEAFDLLPEAERAAFADALLERRARIERLPRHIYQPHVTVVDPRTGRPVERPMRLPPAH
jgi:hypothetical protein